MDCSPSSNISTPASQKSARTSPTTACTFSTLAHSSTALPTTFRTRLRWTREMDEALISSLLVSVGEGERGQNGWKPTALRRAHTAVWAVTPSGKTLKQKSVLNKMTSMEKKWRAWRNIFSTPGWSRDPKTGVPVNDPAVMARYFQQHPEAKAFQKKKLEYEEELDQLFPSSVATGAEVQAPEDITRPIYKSSRKRRRSIDEEELDLLTVLKRFLEEYRKLLDAIHLKFSPPANPVERLSRILFGANFEEFSIEQRLQFIHNLLAVEGDVDFFLGAPLEAQLSMLEEDTSSR